MPDENAVQGLDEFQKSIVEGQIGAMILGPLPPEDSPLRPLGEARALARGCIDAARGLQTHLEVSKLRGIAPNDRWWIQMSLVTTHTTASKLMRLLADGVRDVILLTYSRNSPLHTAGITRSNAHDLIATLMLETVRKAWGVIYDREEYGRDEMHPIKQGSKGLTLSTLLTFDKPLVAMIEGQSGPFPLFRDEHLFAVLNAISESLKWDQDDLNARLQWEYVHAARLIDENKQLGENSVRAL